jgi:hypothetical protein
MLIIDAVFLACAVKAVVQDKIVRLLELRDVGYKSSSPDLAFAVSSCGAWLAESDHIHFFSAQDVLRRRNPW